MVCDAVAGAAEKQFQQMTQAPYETFMRQLGLDCLQKGRKKLGPGSRTNVLKTIAGSVKDILYVPAGSWGAGDSARIQDLKELRAHLNRARGRWEKHTVAKDLGRELAKEFRSYRVRDHFNRQTLSIEVPNLNPRPYTFNL